MQGPSIREDFEKLRKQKDGDSRLGVIPQETESGTPGAEFQADVGTRAGPRVSKDGDVIESQSPVRHDREKNGCQDPRMGSTPVLVPTSSSSSRTATPDEKNLRDIGITISSQCGSESESEPRSPEANPADPENPCQPPPKIICVGDANAQAEDEELLTYPDDGLLAWSQVLDRLVLNALSWGYPAAYGVFQLYYASSSSSAGQSSPLAHLPASTLSWPGSVQLFLSFLLCTPAGRLADAGYVRSTAIAGGVLTVAGTALTANAQDWGYGAVFACQGVVTGVGLGLMFMPGVSVVSSYFWRHRSLALAVSATGTGLGSVVFPATVQYLIPRVGFAWAVRCQALVAAVFALSGVALLRPRLKPRKSGDWIEWAAWREPEYCLYTAGSWLVFLALHFGFFYVNVYAREVLSLPPIKSIPLLLITNALTIPARPVVGFLADRVLGPINTFTIACTILSFTLFVWISITTIPAMYAFCVLFGFCNGAAQGVFVGSLASLTKDPTKMGVRFGMVGTLVAFATLAGPPTAGAIIDAQGGKYIGVQVWGGTVILLGAGILGCARMKATGWRLRARI